MGKGFKTEAIGEITPEVVLAQAAEVKWKGVVIIGIPAESEIPDEHKKAEISVLMNSAKISAVEESFLIQYWHALFVGSILSQPFSDIKDREP